MSIVPGFASSVISVSDKLKFLWMALINFSNSLGEIRLGVPPPKKIDVMIRSLIRSW